VAQFAERLKARGAADKGRAAYLYQLRTTCAVAARLAGHSVTVVELFRDPALLGRALVDDRGLGKGRRLSMWTLAQRRSAIRSVATLLHAELEPLLGATPHTVINQALRRVAERVGAGYRLTGGAPRRRGGSVPTADDITALLGASRLQPGYLGLRNYTFFLILAETGTRVNALRMLDGGDCVEMPSGCLRLFLHEKGKAEPREVELSRAAADSLRAYVRAFNRLAVAHRWATRIRLGEPGPIWRNSRRGRWSYEKLCVSLRAACDAAEVPSITPHALRRAFATDAASVLPRHVVALAGGWQGLERLDDHYIHPRDAVLWQKVARLEQHGPRVAEARKADHAATPSD
jgi:integrase